MFYTDGLFPGFSNVSALYLKFRTKVVYWQLDTTCKGSMNLFCANFQNNLSRDIAYFLKLCWHIAGKSSSLKVQ